MKPLALFLYTLAFVACAALTPPPVEGMPCGMHAHPCGNGSCCDTGFDCGGTIEFRGCPPGLCCFSDGQDEVIDAKRDTKPRHQFTEKKP